MNYPTWQELLSKKNKTPVEKTLVQCIITLTPLLGYSSMTPEEVYDTQVEFAMEMETLSKD